MTLKIRHKVLAISLIPPLVIGLAVLVTIWILSGNVRKTAGQELTELLKGNLAQITSDTVKLARTSHETTMAKLESDLSVAQELLEQAGGVSLRSGRVRWEAINQLTHDRETVRLPQLSVAGEPLERVDGFDRKAPLVDRVQSLLGGTCTIFQRMNEQGDMLRVATNVERKDGSRAVGTYIPALHPDGSRDPVVSTVLDGGTYRGRAFVVNDWYLTSYAPLRDDRGRVIGMLYVGLRPQAIEALTASIMETEIGSDGYVFVLAGSGDRRGEYIISKGGQRNGENIWDAQDADGNHFIQDLVKDAVASDDGDVGFAWYPWQNEGEAEPRMKVAAYSYFEPWDWVIGSTMYKDDAMAVQDTLLSALSSMGWTCITITLLLLAVVGIAAMLFVKRLSSPIETMATAADGLAKGDVSQQVSHVSNDELGVLADSFRRLIHALSQKADVARAIAAGNVDVEVEVASEKDVLGQAMTEMRNNIQALIHDTKRLSEAAQRGQLDERADAARHDGEFRSIVEGINATLEAMVRPIRVTADHLDRISRGDIPARIDEEYQGEFDAIKRSLNGCIDAMNGLLGETEQLIAACRQGRLDELGRAGEFEGSWRQLVAGMNAMVQAIAEPLEEIGGAMDKLAEGNLTAQVDGEFQGAFGELKDAANRMTARMRDAVGTINGNAETLAAASQQLRGSSETLASSAEEASSQANVVSAATEQISANVQSVSSGAEEMSASIQEISQSASEATGVASNAVRQAEETSTRVHQLESASQEIGQVVKLITSIAEQTNLLALNATIEAARAGEAGKGFAVVASEVKELAKQTAEATETIRSKIEAIQSTTSSASASIGEIGRVVQQIEQAQQAIAASVEEQTATTGEIARNVSEAAQGTGEITRNMSELAEATRNSSQGASEALQAAGELSRMADDLKTIVGQFRL
jgi:methyl-accepting chemotaxis protein